jgi:predicted transposase/invertase (TIGR01784 family)
MKFLDVRTDYAFKKVFGSENSKDILISFLNALIYFDSERKIKDLTIVDPYNIPMLKGMKDSFVDVKAILDDNSKVIIEMQILNHKGFEKRVLYNAAKNYSVQLDKSEAYHLLNPVIALSILDFEMFEKSDEVISNFKLIEKTQLIDYSDDIELVFVELPKFNKTLEELQDIKEQWIYFLKNAGGLEYIPNNIDKEIKKALEYSNEANMTKEELELQHKKKEWIYIQKSALELAQESGMEKGLEKGMAKGMEKGMEKGMVQGLERGRQKGIEEEKINTAKISIKQGLDNKTISAITSLEESVIESLRESHK